jgi:hypothetical protein
VKKMIGLALTALLGLQSAALADSITFRLRAFDDNAVDVSFYSQNRKAAWPGNGLVWTIRDYDVHSYKLNCIPGEKICYGAWVRGSSNEYWGVGQSNRNRCTKCCYTCEDGFVTPIVNMNE